MHRVMMTAFVMLCLCSLAFNRGGAGESRPALSSSPRFVEKPAALSAGRLNEFVLDGTESCVEIKKGSSAVRPSLSAVTNAATYTGRIAPGGLAVLWGSGFSESGEEYSASGTRLPRLLGRVQVLWRAANWDLTITGFNDRCGWRAAPLLYVGPHQINFQVPMFFYKPIADDEGNGYGRFANFEGREYEFIVLEVLRDGVTKVSSNTIRLKVNSHAPEFFSNGIVNYPSWQVPTEISSGQTLIAYLTGLGKISDHEPEGTVPPEPPWTTSFPTVIEYRTIGGVRLLRAGYLYAGRAPGLFGVDQINLIVPDLPLASGQPVSIHLCTGSDDADRCSERGMIFPWQGLTSQSQIRLSSAQVAIERNGTMSNATNDSSQDQAGVIARLSKARRASARRASLTNGQPSRK